MHLTRRIVALALASLLIAAQARAQLSVRVIAAPDRSLANAQVELWSPTARVATQVTGSDGRARFSSADARAASAALVRLIGFRPERVALAASVDTLNVRLTALPSPLPTVTVSDAETQCPMVDSPDARGRWERARSLYSAPNLLGRTSMLETGSGTIGAEALGDVSRMRIAKGSRAYTVAGMEGARHGIGARGYVYPLTESHNFKDYGVWAYPALTREYAEHFAEAVFGERHTLAVVSVGPDSLEAVLAFCARDRRQTGLDGTLRIGEDGTFLSARWMFYNRARGAERAGGEVVFAPRDRSTPTPTLLAAQGIFWRRLPSGMYYQRWEQYERWTFIDDRQR